MPTKDDATRPIKRATTDEHQDMAASAKAKGAHPVTGDAAADANRDARSAADKAREQGRSVPTAEKTPVMPPETIERHAASAAALTDAGSPPPPVEPSGALDAAARERENTEFKANMPPDRRPDRVEQAINEAAGVSLQAAAPADLPPGAGQDITAIQVGELVDRKGMERGSPAASPPVDRSLEARIERDVDDKRTPRQDALDDAADARGQIEDDTPPAAPKPSKTTKKDDGLTFRRRFHDSSSGTSLDRWRQEILAQVRGQGHTPTRLKETVVPPLDQPNADGQRDWTIVVEVE